MTAQDHNKTLVVLMSAFAAFFTLGLIASPWIIAKNFNDSDKILLAIVIFGIVFLMALLLWSTVVVMHRRKPPGQEAGASLSSTSIAGVLAYRCLCLVVHA